MEVDLPVWTIRPNWKHGVLERLSWLTDVLTSDTGVEQRRSVRLSPRRGFEITVNPTQRERTYLDLLLHRLGSKLWFFPIWHDQAKTVQALAANAARVPIDNTYREFLTGGYALLFIDAFTYEVVQISGQDDTGLDLAAAGRSAKEWPLGTKVYPLRRAWLDDTTALAAITSRVGESVLTFQVNEANLFDEADDEELDLFEGSPLMTVEPNRVRALDVSHVRLATDMDGETGLTHRADTAGRAFQVQAHNWTVVGRENQAAFRRFMYRLNGRQRMVWLPSFNEDVKPTVAVAAGAAQVRIDGVGMRYVGGSSPIPGRATLWTGREVLRIGSILAPTAPNEDRVGLATPAVFGYAPGASWQFLQAARLDTDTIELQHYTDSDGVFECSATFRTFANVRDASGSNFQPIPATAMSPGACGEGEANPCDITFPGWFWKVGIQWQQPMNTGIYPGLYDARLPQASPIFPNGAFLVNGANIARATISSGAPNNGNFVIEDVAGGFNVRDFGTNGPLMMTFRYFGEPNITGYEWTFYFPLDPNNHGFGFSHQIQRPGFPTGDDYPASIYMQTWDNTRGATANTVVYRTFPAGYGINY